MLKKLLTFLAAASFALAASAQFGNANPTVQQSDIEFWTGTGSNRAVIAVTWNDEVAGAIGIAWGVQWDGTATIGDIMDTIALYDSRFSLDASSSWVNNMGYTDPELGLDLLGTEGWWWYNWKDVADDNKQSGGVSYDYLEDGDFVDWIQTAVADEMFMASNPNVTTDPEPSTTITFSDIDYWVGEGDGQAIVAVSWDSFDTALAWGVRYDSEYGLTVQDALDTISFYDSRFAYQFSIYGYDMIMGFASISYTEGDLSLTKANYETPCVWMDGNYLSSPDMDDWTFEYAEDDGFILISTGCYEIYSGITPVSNPNAPADTTTTEPTDPVEPQPVEATIAAADILYWVGEGANEVVMAVNWVDTALAWGYRFSDSTVSVASVMAGIAAADPRFDYVGSAGFLSDITYIDTAAGMTDTLRITAGNYWGSTNNGISDMGMGQQLHAGDFEKWADPAAGIAVDSSYWEGYGWFYINVYPMTIHPVSVPDTTSTPVEPGTDTNTFQPLQGPFCGPVGSEGCDAIAADSSAIVAWAAAVSIERGPQDISAASSPLATYGTEADAIGQPSMTINTGVVSLGDGGVAVVTFNRPIRNGEGPDFAVFENGFENNIFGLYSLELAFVEVSTDGERYVRFPATSLTPTEQQTGNAGGTDPTLINNLAGKYVNGYGTPFDLAELADSTGIDIDSIVYVRIVDVVGSIDPQYGTRDSHGNLVNDPWPTPFASSGFDLAGVAVLHQLEAEQPVTAIAEADGIVASLYPNPTSSRIVIAATQAADAQLFDQSGRLVASLALQQGSNSLDLSGLAQGIYMLRCGSQTLKVVKR